MEYIRTPLCVLFRNTKRCHEFFAPNVQVVCTIVSTAASLSGRPGFTIRRLAILTGFFHGFPQCASVNGAVISQTRLLPYISEIIHESNHGTEESELEEASLNKQTKC